MPALVPVIALQAGPLWYGFVMTGCRGLKFTYKISNWFLTFSSSDPPSHHRKQPTMPIIKIDNQDYDLDTLSADVKGQLASIQFVDAELQRLGAQTAALQTARMAYANALKQALVPAAPVLSGDTIKFTH